MTFASFEFAAFLLLVLMGRSLCRSRSGDNWLLLLASYAFYASWSVPSVLLILTVSLVDYHVGRRLAVTELPRDRKRWLAVSIGTNLGLLGFFKYTNFLVANAGWAARLFGFDTAGWRFDIILPVGISFFTFKSMSYTLDVYRRSIQPCQSVRDYLLFVSFFPQLLAGPIVRASELLPQLARRVRASAAGIESGLAQFALGATKKLVLADQVAGHVDLIFAAPGQFDALTLVQGALGYAVQIYCDFSGYSDMAIGAARIMGYRTPENFQMPYTRHRHHGLLAPLAHLPLFLVPRLSLPAARLRPLPPDAGGTLRWGPRGRRHLHRRDPGDLLGVRPLAWRGLDLRPLGRPPWNGARRSPRLEAVAAIQEACASSMVSTRLAGVLARGDTRGRRRGMDSVPRRVPAHRVAVPHAHRRVGVRRHAAAVALHPPGLPCGACCPRADE